MEYIRRVLETYNIYPLEIDKISKRLYRIKGHNQVYALKKSSLTSDTLPLWLNNYQIANALNLVHILPVYLNRSGDLQTEQDGDIYYLTPWIQSVNRANSLEKIYQSLGLIHAKTRQVNRISDKPRQDIRESFLIYKQKMTDLKKDLLKHVERFEQRHFMSPIELLVCTQYRDVVHACYLLDRRLNQYLDQLEELTEWRICLCHGRLIPEHILQNDHTYLVNWEHASYKHPIDDLTTLLGANAINYDAETKDLMQEFNHYMDENKLENHELNLLGIYLLDPTAYITLIDQFTSTASEKSMIEQVVQIQRLHRQLLFGVQFSEHITAEYEMLSFDESSSDA
ncbi:phosphotransferase [Ornithinibacillus xuwenensis]|uniref:Aminoglycoside phosphotransferase domain-containing protein n=1 Tax=Ornithinibacillus xuwenensis TaxID=3144668 RepID=A0ABU9XBT3_9BACI